MDIDLQPEDASPVREADSVESPISLAALGFEPVQRGIDQAGEQLAWGKHVGGRPFVFRALRTLAELEPTEQLQRDVFGLSDVDVIPPNALLNAHDTGGDVLAAFPETGELAGYLVCYGGYVQRRPRMLSDFLVVDPAMRSVGVATELKKVQAGIAIERGFDEVIWTVDPLRAMNARLNFEKLGAVSNHYEVNRYGETFGTGLYGGMPTDRLQLSWMIGSERVKHRLLGRTAPIATRDVDDLIHFDPDKPDAERALVHIPADIDALLAADPNAAMRWRLSLRETLPKAFAAGFKINGFVPDTVPELELSSLVLSKSIA